MSREEIITDNPIVDFVRDRGHELKRAGENFVTSGCPVKKHKKHHRPVTIDTDKNLWHCNDCDVGGSVVDWLMQEKNITADDALRELGGGRNGTNPATRPQIIATYDYTDEAGTLLFQCVRYQPKKFRQRRPDGNGGWIWNLGSVRRVLYHLPELEEAETVCVAEGEKDVDNLRALGLTATCNPMGAGKWRDDFSWNFFRSKKVFIFGDNDESGRAHVAQIFKGIGCSSKAVVRLPDGFHDISDFIKSFSSSDEAKTATQKLIEQARIRNSQGGDLSDISYKSELTPGLKSQPSSDHPTPLSPDAYHGLAGAFVQCVLPETEADPAALLIQFLAAFGNAINRRAHAIADGSRHALNIYATIVGPTSKSRKRTSWTHVYRVFEHADDEWAKNRVTGGLSSGEGLIWNVRDSISKTVKGETQVVDEGVDDKRLFVCEEEFASILKMMQREGNVLSTVLRSAWDSGKLSTLVKNNPARATGAHISVVGHITREELRRLLTETEQGNGFGNRFLWLLIKRSKVLPEGGLTPAIADIVDELKKALEFARGTEEITRTEAARKLWREIYPALSEGKPGLVGALTARSEAQVLRLSCIYALLDCKRVVDVAHLKAALEVWRYCEDSARLIFESGTGNKDADRVLQALKVAGESGLSRTELVHDVFSRHATRFEIDEALRLLHGLDLAHYKREDTAGRPAERWFAANHEHQ